MQDHSHKKIYVKNIPEDILSKDLQHYFEAFGPVFSAVVIGPKKGRANAYGFVSFFSKRSALKALAVNHKMHGIDLVVEPICFEKTKCSLIKNSQKFNRQFLLFIQDIPKDANKELLVKHFSKYGELVRLKLVSKPEKMKDCVYLEYKDLDSAVKAKSLKHKIPGFCKENLTLVCKIGNFRNPKQIQLMEEAEDLLRTYSPFYAQSACHCDDDGAEGQQSTFRRPQGKVDKLISIIPSPLESTLQNPVLEEEMTDNPCICQNQEEYEDSCERDSCGSVSACNFPQQDENTPFVEEEDEHSVPLEENFDQNLGYFSDYYQRYASKSWCLSFQDRLAYEAAKPILRPEDDYRFNRRKSPLIFCNPYPELHEEFHRKVCGPCTDQIESSLHTKRVNTKNINWPENEIFSRCSDKICTQTKRKISKFCEMMDKDQFREEASTNPVLDWKKKYEASSSDCTNKIKNKATCTYFSLFSSNQK